MRLTAAEALDLRKELRRLPSDEAVFALLEQIKPELNILFATAETSVRAADVMKSALRQAPTQPSDADRAPRSSRIENVLLVALEIWQELERRHEKKRREAREMVDHLTWMRLLLESGHN